MRVSDFKIENKIEVLNEAKDGKKVIYLYGPIRGKSIWDDENSISINSSSVRDLLEDSEEDVTIHLNTPGGSVFESIAICNFLKTYKGNVEVIVDALAASGGSIICAGADKVKMYGNSMQMIHNAWTFAYGNADELRKEAENLDKINNSVTASYKDKFIGTDEELKALLDAETWLTAEDCKTLGLCDEVIEKEDKEPQPIDPKEVKNSILSKYMNNEKPDDGAGKVPFLIKKFKGE